MACRRKMDKVGLYQVATPHQRMFVPTPVELAPDRNALGKDNEHVDVGSVAQLVAHPRAESGYAAQRLPEQHLCPPNRCSLYSRRH